MGLIERLETTAYVLLPAGLVLAISGCWALVIARARRLRRGGGAGTDAALGLLCIVPGLLVAVVAGDVGLATGSRVVSIVVAFVFLSGGITLLALSIRSYHSAHSVASFGIDEGTPYLAARRYLRAMGRVLTGVGLAVFCGSVVAAVAVGRDAIPAGLPWTGPSVAAGGCTGLATIVGLLFPPRGRVGIDAMLGLLCIPVGLLHLLWASGAAGVGIELLYFLVVGSMLAFGGAALAIASVGGFRQKGVANARTQV
jgi:hypothetical protein